ncbi:VanW family protein [Patulibacter sp. SYSU D01012]|uniref:VanW family protein n=1 Tax=Patulibacter sp. SYSU D01012 TaxID=2817381 RepID=UPI001B308714
MLALVVVLTVVLAVLVASFAVGATHDGKALPGTRVAGVDVGGATAAQIARRLRPDATAQRTLRLRAAGRTIPVKASATGYAVDLGATAREAVAAGRDGVVGKLVGPLVGLVAHRDVALDATFDERRMARTLAKVDEAVGEAADAGALRVDPDSLEVTTTTSRPGRTVDRPELERRLRARLRTLGSASVDVPLKTVPAVSQGRLESIAAEAEDYLRTPLRLTAAGSTLELTAGETARLLALESLQDGRRARLGADGDGLSAVLDRAQRRWSRAARDARVSAPATAGSLTDKGSVSWSPKRAGVRVTPARSGRAVDRDALAGRIRAAVRDGRHAVKVPRKTTAPEVSTAEARKARYLIGTFTTPYVAGQPRVTNIRRMARTVDGTVIAPGAQFSLNGITGQRTKAKGYVEAPFIANNKIEPSVGGGVSQFSTTMYNAAYFAGLQLDAHRAHSLYIDRYPPGRESTLNFPDIDLQWTNDTDTPVYVRTSYDDAGVTVSLYGNNGGRRVSAKAGSREPVEGGDFQITVTRTVRYADGRVARQPVTTRYENEQEGGGE